MGASQFIKSGKGAVSIETYGKSFATIEDYLKSIQNSAIPVYQAGGKTYTINYATSGGKIANLNDAKLVEVQPKPAPKPTTQTDSGLVKYESPTSMKFNLPPHEWSLPLNPSALNTSAKSKATVDHAQRRAMMWYYGGADTTTGANLIMPPTSAASQTASPYSATAKDNFWGFQFLWNPQNLQNALSRNANVIPSALDSFAALNGLFTAMESLQFTIIIDRINDFACARSTFDSAKAKGLTDANFAPFYRKGGNPGVLQDFPTQFKELMAKGTMADVEHLYKMINGAGQNGQVWVNGLGRKTADLGFLSPTAIALRFGPNPDSLSYVGWVESLSVNHTMFTEDMIPLHTEVSVSFNAFSRVSLTSGN